MSENAKNLECTDVKNVATQSEAVSAHTNNAYHRDLFGVIAALASTVGSMACTDEKNVADAKAPANTPQTQQGNSPSNVR